MSRRDSLLAEDRSKLYSSDDVSQLQNCVWGTTLTFFGTLCELAVENLDMDRSCGHFCQGHRMYAFYSHLCFIHKVILVFVCFMLS